MSGVRTGEPEEWADRPTPEDAAIKAAFPTRSGRDDLYAEAMRLVRDRHSKGALVALVNWLLFRLDTAPLTRDDIEADRPACIEDFEKIARLVPHDSEPYRIAVERLSVLQAFDPGLRPSEPVLCESCERKPASAWCSECIVEDYQAAEIARGVRPSDDQLVDSERKLSTAAGVRPSDTEAAR